MRISERMAKELASESALTRRLLERIPDDQLDWKPGRELHTIGWNAVHLVQIIGWVPGIVEGSEWDIAPVGAPPDVAPVVTRASQLLEMLDEQLPGALAALQGVSDVVLDQPWSLKMGGQVLFTMAKGDCLRKWVFSHTAHHRGILSAYLRLAGLEFPSIYEE